VSKAGRYLWLLVAIVVMSSPSAPSRMASSVIATTPQISSTRKPGRRPVSFETNTGHYDPSIRFVARQGKSAIALRDDGASLVLRPRAPSDDPTASKPIVLRLAPDGARKIEPRPEGLLASKTNYFLGSDPSKWRTDVPSYTRVTYPSVLPNVDLVYHADNGALEYDLVVAPGADVDRVVMNVSGADSISLTERGDLRIHTSAGDLIQPPPVAYQRRMDGQRSPIGSSYRLVGENSVGFRLAAYDRSRALVIDPMLSSSTYFGGTGLDLIMALGADAEGNVYLAGVTDSVDFPTAGALDTSVGSTDVFVAKLDPAGQELLYSTYLGGSLDDEATAVSVAADGGVYVAGWTQGDFPVVSGLPGTVPPDAFLARLNPAGNGLVFATYLPAISDTLWRSVTGLAADATGVYLSMSLHPAGGYVMKIAPDAAGVLWQMDLRGPGTIVPSAIALDGAGALHVAGYANGGFPQTSGALKPACDDINTDGVIARVKNDGSGLDWATCLGGTGTDWTYGMAFDATNNLYVTGATTSVDFPVLPATSVHRGGYDAFITKVEGSSHALVYSRYLGAEGDDFAQGVAIDAAGTAWVMGYTNSFELPLLSPTQPFGGWIDTFLTRVSADGTPQFSTYYGGTNADIGEAVVASGGGIVFAGRTRSNDVPLIGARLKGSNVADTWDGFVGTVSPLSVGPSVGALAPNQQQQFTATEGVPPYQFDLLRHGGGGSITPNGLYTAGTTATSTADVVRVTDKNGSTGIVTVFVVSTPLSLSPTQTNAPPRGSVSVLPSGGLAPYDFTLVTNNSGGSVVGGAYTAGSMGGTIDILRVTDRTGVSAYARVDVGVGVTIAPTNLASVPPRSSVHFTAAGGSGAGYTWNLVSSGGSTIDNDGNYTASIMGGWYDLVQVTDSLGNTSGVTVTVSSFEIAPSNPLVPPRGTIAFSATGGAKPLTWALSFDSRGTLDPVTGLYVAGAKGTMFDTVLAYDSLGNTVLTVVQIGPEVALIPEGAIVGMGARFAFTATGGDGKYLFSIDSSESGSKITAGGLFTTGSKPGTDVVRVVDSLGNSATTTIRVIAGAPSTVTDAGVDASVQEPDNDAGVDDGGPRSPKLVSINGWGCRASGNAGQRTPTSTLGAIGVSFVLGLALRRRRSPTVSR
jgi:hypothetical protein